MKLRLYDRADAPEVLRLWNTVGAAAGYAPLDADKLDVLGAIGAVRAVVYAALAGTPTYT